MCPFRTTAPLPAAHCAPPPRPVEPAFSRAPITMTFTFTFTLGKSETLAGLTVTLRKSEALSGLTVALFFLALSLSRPDCLLHMQDYS